MKYAQMMDTNDLIPKTLILLALELFISKKMIKDYAQNFRNIYVGTVI